MEEAKILGRLEEKVDLLMQTLTSLTKDLASLSTKLDNLSRKPPRPTRHECEIFKGTGMFDYGHGAVSHCPDCALND